MDLVFLQMKEKTEAGEESPVVTKLHVREYAMRKAGGVVDDPITFQDLEDVVIIIF